MRAKLGALPLDGGLRAARPAASGDGLLQAGALGVLRQRNVAAESGDRSRERGQSAGRRQNPPCPSALRMPVFAAFISSIASARFAILDARAAFVERRRLETDIAA